MKLAQDFVQWWTLVLQSLDYEFYYQAYTNNIEKHIRWRVFTDMCHIRKLHFRLYDLIDFLFIFTWLS